MMPAPGAARARLAVAVLGMAGIAAAVVARAPAVADDGTVVAQTGQGDAGAVAELDDAGRALLEAALTPASADLVATLAVIAFDEAGPTVSEYRVRAQAGGDLVAVTSGRWSFARTAEDVIAQVRGGPTLRLGAVADRDTTAASLLVNYDVEVGEPELLDTGPAIPLVLIGRDDGVRRERLWVDEGLRTLVRRETYGRDGVPQRLMALTSLDVITPRSARTTVDEPESRGPLVDLTVEAAATLGRTGWVTPSELPGGYRLRDAFAMGDGTTSALHLVYSDGLYTMSVYEQRGQLATGSLASAVRDVHGDMTLWRWPGAEPERLVWSDGSMTYAAVTDAPHDVVLRAISGLPHHEPLSIRERFGRGLGRVLSWLNPVA